MNSVQTVLNEYIDYQQAEASTNVRNPVKDK